MSDKKLPPPMRRSVLLKLKAKNVLSKLKTAATAIIAYALIMASVGFLVVKGPELHGQYLRHAVGSKVYMIKGRMDGGGGTGFAVKAPSGQNYIVTNAHVCEGALEQSSDKQSLLVVNEKGAMRRKIIEVSSYSDLCLLEGLPGVEGLSLGSEPSIGETVAVVGHPALRPLSLSRGEIVGSQDVAIISYVLKTGDEELDKALGASDKQCDLPKNQKAAVMTFFGPLNVCIDITKASYMSTAVIHPGNSGSPVVDFFGNVQGVAFALDRTSWAYIVSLKDLQFFIARY